VIKCSTTAASTQKRAYTEEAAGDDEQNPKPFSQLEAGFYIFRERVSYTEILVSMNFA